LFSIATFFSLASSRSAAIFIASIAASRLPSAKVSHAAAASFWIRVWPARGPLLEAPTTLWIDELGVPAPSSWSIRLWTAAPTCGGLSCGRRPMDRDGRSVLKPQMRLAASGERKVRMADLDWPAENLQNFGQ
jgi:hypothetical protein